MRFFTKSDDGSYGEVTLAMIQKSVKQVGLGKDDYDLPAHAAVDKTAFSPCRTNDFEFGPVLGTGSFGRVRLATHSHTGTVCAVKILSKAQILNQDQLIHMKQEKAILDEVAYPFMVNLFGATQDRECLYMFMEYVVGGELFTHLRDAGRFNDTAARFYAAEVLLAIDYLHARNVVYRDLKPENLLLDKDGHIKLTDFGFAKRIVHRTYTLCGTPDYLAPEIILNKGHGKPVDWWALGVLIYEMLAGFPPFYADDPMTTYKKIVAGRLEFPAHFSRIARDLIRKLLQPDLTKRYGNLKAGSKDIKTHPWFASVDWKKLSMRNIKPPFKPTCKGGSMDTSNYEDYSELGPIVHEYELGAQEQALFNTIGFGDIMDLPRLS